MVGFRVENSVSDETTIMLGGQDVRLIRKQWTSGNLLPYKKTYTLLPGQSWFDAEETPRQSEHYVNTGGNRQVPIGALIAEELINKGADMAAFTELWGTKPVLVNHNLICISDNERLVQILNYIRKNNQGRLGGLPDVMAVFPDGRIAFREAKNVRAKDSLSKNQHAFAQLLRRLYKDKLDIAVVEWDFPNN